MKHLIQLIVVFIIGVVVGAYRGRNTVQNKAIEVATQAYENGLNAVVASGSEAVTAQSQIIIDDLKEQGKDYIQQALKDQIDGFFQ